MDYKLAKKLKDAEFPFYAIIGGDRVLCREVIDFCPTFDASKGDSFDTQCHFLIPTLSELIEACGENFRCLDHLSDMNLWRAIPPQSINLVGEGVNPEEAVANLWLKLNQK